MDHYHRPLPDFVQILLLQTKISVFAPRLSGEARLLMVDATDLQMRPGTEKLSA